MPLLEAARLSKSYRRAKGGPLLIFDGLSLSVEPGERVAIVGKSGSGKSTLLNLLGGLDRPDNRDAILRIDGTDCLRASESTLSRLRASTIGFVFQSFHLLPDLTVLENACLPGRALAAASARETRARALRLLEAAGLSGRLDHRPSELSGGEQQRTAIVRALVNGPKLLLADEPTGNLDPATGTSVLDLLFNLAGEADVARPALVMVTHGASVAARCDRVLLLEGGALRETASAPYGA